MDDEKKHYIVAEEQGTDGEDHSIVIISSNWLTPKKSNAFWPRYKNTYNKCLLKHDSPDENWQLITLKRKFYETEDLIIARKKAKQAESLSDLNDDDDGVGKKRLTSRPIRMIESDTSVSSEGSLELFGIDKEPGNRGKQNQEKLRSVSLQKKYGKSEDMGVPSYNQFHSNDTPEKEISLESTDSQTENNSLIHDKTITPKYTGVYEQKIMHMLTTLVEQNNQILNWIRSQSETELLKQTKEPVELPVQLPICEENELATLEEYLNDDANFGEMCNYFMAYCGHSPTSSVNQIMKKILTNELAAKFSYRGKKGKRPFEQLNLKSVVIRSVKKHFKLPLETSIENDIKVWLKHAPQRVKTSMKKLNSSSNKDNLINI